MRYVETVYSGEMGRVIMPSSDIGEGLTVEFVLEKLNSSNCFDFDYLPQERDCLKIRLKDRNDKYLALHTKMAIGHSVQITMCLMMYWNKLKTVNLKA